MCFLRSPSLGGPAYLTARSLHVQQRTLFKIANTSRVTYPSMLEFGSDETLVFSVHKYVYIHTFVIEISITSRGLNSTGTSHSRVYFYNPHLVVDHNVTLSWPKSRKPSAPLLPFVELLPGREIGFDSTKTMSRQFQKKIPPPPLPRTNRTNIGFARVSAQASAAECPCCACPGTCTATCGGRRRTANSRHPRP